ncbi:hypothetical protein, partial [Salmonella sp. s51228]|uniref:hypothetical protein n=1 Tax=Salmonella sp. s51228 TaxID=3159652 RepID=UPI003980FC0E
RAGTDRSNIVLLKGPGYDDISVPQSFLDGTQYGWWSRSYPELLTENTFLNMSRDLADNLAKLTPGQFRGEMSELDDAGTYYDLPLYKVTRIGTYYYLCTRNNNFTNRSQKGVVIVTPEQVTTAVAGVSGTVLETESA